MNIIDQIMENFKVSRNDALTILEIAKRKSLTIAQAYKELYISKSPEAYSKDYNKIISQRKVHPLDRHDTQRIPLGRSKKETRTYVGPDGIERKERYILPPGKYASVYKRMEGEERTFTPLSPPRYYYFALDGFFDPHGYELPPMHDRQFRDKGNLIPYIKAQTAYVRSPSKHGKYDEGAGGFIKGTGRKTIQIDFMIGNQYFNSKAINMSYENDVRFNMMKSQQATNVIYDELTAFIKEHQSHKVYGDVRLMKPEDDKFKEYYGDWDPSKARKRHKKKPKIKRKPAKRCICKKSTRQKVAKRRLVKKIIKRRKVRKR
jgi:hypothetical protein